MLRYRHLAIPHLVCAILIAATILPMGTALGQGSCPPVGLPIVEDFNTTDSLPTCWERDENFDLASMKAHIVGSPTYNGIGALMISCGADNDLMHQSFVMGPRLSTSPAGIRMKMKVRANQAGAVLMVGACESTSNFFLSYGFQAIDTLTVSTPNVWIDYEVDFSDYTGSGDRLAFRMMQSMQGGLVGNEIYLDEMTVERCSVSDLWVSHRASDELTLHWQSIGDGTANLTVTPSTGGTPLTFNGVTSPYRILGLSPSTTYQLTLTPQCTGESLDGLPKSTTGTTLPGPHEGLVYCEGFESVQMPTGWESTSGAMTSTTRSYNGSRSLYLSSGSGYAVLPQIALTGGTLVPIGQLMLNPIMYASSGSVMLEVGLTNYPLESDLITPIDTITPAVASSWGTYTILLTPGTAEGRYLVLRAIGSGSLYIDDLRAGRCLLTGVTVAGKTSTSITLEWDVPLVEGSVVIEPVVGGGSTLTVTADQCTTANGKRHYTIDGLAPGSSHSYSVYGSCDPDHCGAATVAATTYSQDYGIPYCTDFEGNATLPTDWQNAYTHNNCPQTSTEAHNSGTRSLKLSASGSVGSSHSLTILPPVQATGNSTVVVSLAAYSQYSGCTVEVGTIDASGNESTFTATASCTPTQQWTRYTLNVGNVGTQRIALRFYHNGYSTRTAFVDDLEVGYEGVSNIYAYGERANGATLAWTATGDSVDIQLRRAGSIWTATYTNATSPLVLDSLEEGSTYNFYVRCRVDGTTGCWMYAGSFTTNSDALRADYCHPYTFNIGQSLWSLPYLEENSYTGLRVSLEAMGSGTVQVGLMTDPDNSSTFTQIGSSQINSSNWSRIAVSLTGHEAQGHYIALRCTGNAQVQRLRLGRGDIVSTTASGIGATQATLHWTTDGAPDSVHLAISQGLTVVHDTMLAASVTQLTITGLTAGTEYSYTLTAINTASQRSCSNLEATFVTLNADIVDGWCEDFDGYSYGTLPTGWSVVSGNGSDPAVYYNSSSSRLRMTSSSSTTAMVALPTALSSISNLRLRAEVHASGSGVAQSMLVVGMMTDATSQQTFVPLDTIRPTTTAQVYAFNLGSYSGTGRTIALRYISPSGSCTLYADNMGLATQQVSQPVADQVTDHSVRLRWQSSPNVHITGSGVDTIVHGAYQTIIDGLASNTAYSFTIHAIGADSTSACQTASVNTHTLPEPMTVPLCASLDDYNSNTQLPYGWTRPFGSYPVSYTGTVYEGSRSLRFYTSGHGTTMVVSPMIEESSLDGLYLSFFLYNSSSNGTMQVGLMTDPADTSTFVPLQSYGYNSGWARYELSLANAPMGAQYIAFRYNNTGSYSSTAYLDHLMLVQCPMPTAYISNPRSHSLEVHWSYANSDANSVQILCDNQSVITSTSPYTITGLSSSTNHTVYVRPVCGDSTFVCHRLTLSGQTLPEPVDLPFCQYFSNYYYPSNWSTWSDSGSVNLIYTSFDGSRALRLYSYSGASVSAILPQIDTTGHCAALDSIYLTLKLASENTIPTGTQLQIGVVTDLLSHSSFHALQNIPLTGVNNHSWLNVPIGVSAASLAPGFLAIRLVAPSNSNASLIIDDLCMGYCFATNIAIDTSTPNSITFSWNSLGADSLTISWAGGSVTTTSSPVTVPGFLPNDTYSFGFTAHCPCHFNHTSNYGHTQRFPAEPMVMPVCYNFDELATGAYPNNWRRTGGAWSSYPRVASAGGESRVLDLYTNYNSPLTTAMEPLPDGATSVVASLKVWCNNADIALNDRLILGTMTNPENGATFTALQSLVVNATETWQTFHVLVPQPSERYIAIRFAPQSTYHCYIDELSVTACSIDTLIAIDNSIHVTTLGNTSGYLLDINPIGSFSSRTIGPFTATDIPFATIGIASDSAYNISARTICGSGDTIGCTSESITIGIRHSLPYCETFDATALHPYGWEVIHRNSATYPRIENGAYHMQPNGNNTAENDMVALPLLPSGQTLGGLHLRITTTLSSNSDCNYAYLELGHLVGGTFTPLTELHNTTYQQTHYVTIPASTATRLVLRARSINGIRDIYLSNMQLTTYPEPAELHLTQTGYRQQHLYWENLHNNSQYSIEYGPYGFTPGRGTTVASDSCHALLAPLTASTRYQYYLVDTAGNRFCYPHEFTSLPAPMEIPYCTSGTSSYPNGQLYILPESPTPLQSLTLLLTWQCAGNARLVVGAMTDRSDPLTFIPIDTLLPEYAYSWQRDSIRLINYSDTGHFAALLFEGGTGYISQLTLQAVPQPTFHVLNSSTIEVTMTGMDSVDYYLRVCTTGTSQSSGALFHVTSEHYLITGLEMYTYYNIYVLSSPAEVTCAPAVTLRTHLDIAPPYCTNLSGNLPDGWYQEGRYLTMPYPLVDSLPLLHLYITGSGSITIGATSALDDTTAFLPLQTVILNSDPAHINPANYITGDLHYLSFRLDNNSSSIVTLNTQTVPRATYHVLSSSTIEASIPDSIEANYYIEACLSGHPQGSGTIYHVTSSPYLITGLTMYTMYDLYVRADSLGVTCDPPTTLRTHLDIEPPYCNLEGSDGWHTSGTFHVMPYAVIDTMIHLYATFTSSGSLTLGVQPSLDDTTSFVPLIDLNSSTAEEHVVKMADYATLIGNRHYLSFRYTGSNTEVQQVYLHTCPVPSASLFAFNTVRFEQTLDSGDYWIAYNDQVVHADTNPFYLTGLEQNTIYNFSLMCDSTTPGCIPPITMLTGVQITAPHCSDLNAHRFTLDGIPAGWFSLDGGQYVIMPIIDLDSASRLFLRLRHRVSQVGNALQVGIMTNPYDANTFTLLHTLSDISPSLTETDLSFANYTDTGLYVAFHAVGNNPQSIIIDRIELQTVPFVNYLLVSWDSVKVVPTIGSTYGNTCYIQYGNTIVAADSLPVTIGPLAADSQIPMSIMADSTIAPCAEPDIIATTHMATTPLCDISLTLDQTQPLWLGPELAEENISTLMLRATVNSAANGTLFAVGTMRLRNVDSTFTPIDTIIVSGAGTVVASLAGYNGAGRFLALRLISGSVNLSGMTLDYCLTPTTASLSLLRHNIVRLYGGSDTGSGNLWLLYGPTGGTQQTMHIDTLPLDFTLNNSTSYSFTLACDSITDVSLTCAPTLSITTLAAPPALSWCEDFNNVATNSLPNDWRMATPQNAAQQTSVDNSRSHTSSKSLHMYSTIGHNSVVVLPDLGMDTLNGLSVSLWLNVDYPTTSVLELGVIYNASDPETFYPLRRLTCNTAGTWERHLVDLSDAPSGAWFIALRCRGVSGTNSIWLDDIHIAECGANSLEVTQVEANQITMRWRQTGSPTVTVTVIPDGEASYQVTAPSMSVNGYRSLTIDNLSALTNYRFAFSANCDNSTGYCTTNYLDTCRVFTPAGGRGCIDPTNLTASYTTCFYGTYGDPVADTGCIDLGYASAQSRHTIHYDISERDPRTGNQLNTVPSGATASVRLGNWSNNSTHPEAEAISYGLTVDTMDFNLLIMRYAAVLQDPNHSPDKQPRFSLELLDETGHVLDSSCGRADFIANYMMGWHAVGNVLWKDWTTVGIDLTPYAGQTIYIRLTTRDCNEGSHYGYAYFTLECMRKNITTSNCGVVADNQLTAPSGFNYYWYTNTSTDTIGTQQTIVVPTDNAVSYYCNLSFVDNPQCHFTMTAFAGTRYPLSLFDYEVSLSQCSFDVNFTNHSTISADGITPVGTGEGVETSVWILGNGDTADSYHASANYPEGLYNVSLVTGIANDACLDTLTIPLNLVLPPTGMEITGPTERCYNQAQDTLWLHNVVSLMASTGGWILADSTVVGTKVQKQYYITLDSASHPVGTYTFTATALDSVGCTLTLSHNVTVHPSYRQYDTLHLCSLLLPYQWRDTTISAADLTPPSSVNDHTIHRYSVHGCDSMMYLHVTLYDNAYFTPRDTAYDNLCDNQQYYFSDSLLTIDATLSHNIGTATRIYTDSLFSSIGCDSLSTIVLTVYPTYDHHLADTVCSNISYTWGTPQRQMLSTDSVNATLHGSDTLVPQHVAAADTSFTDQLHTTHGCDSLSSLHLHVTKAYHLHYYDTICDAHITTFNDDSSANWLHHTYPFETGIYDTTNTYNFQYTTSYFACDSLRTLHLKVYPTYDMHFPDTIYDGDLYTFEQTVYDTTGVYPHTLSAIYACDSLRTLHLQRNRRTYIDSVVCRNTLPVNWYGGLTFADGTGVRMGEMQVIKDSVHLTGLNGIDSLLVMTLIVRDTAATVDIVHSCDSLIWYHQPDTTYRVSTNQPDRRLLQLSAFDTSGLYTQMPPSRTDPFHLALNPYSIQCDSVRHLDLTIDYTHYRTDHRIACDSLLWPTDHNSLTSARWFFRDTLGIPGALGSYSVTGPVDTMVTVGGCDSVVSLDLNVHYATYHCDIDTFCWHQLYNWRTQWAGDTVEEHWPVTDHYYLTDTLQTHVFHHLTNPAVTITCDSVRAIQLTQMARPQLELTDSIDCANELYYLGLRTDVGYTRWSNNRDATVYVNQPDIAVAPTQNTTYRAYVDYHAAPLCPLTANLSLRPIVVPEAVLKVNPEELRYNAMTFDAYDLSTIAPRSIHPTDPDQWTRSWYLDWLMQPETDWHVQYEPLPDEDTLVLALRVYNGQCADTAIYLMPIARAALFAPNVFTPLRDNNNRFFILGHGIAHGELFVYNREGMLLYRTKASSTGGDFEIGWDGRRQDGTLCEQANYVWKLVYTTLDKPDDEKTEVGNILLLR